MRPQLCKTPQINISRSSFEQNNATSPSPPVSLITSPPYGPFLATAADDGTIDYTNLYYCANRSTPADVLVGTFNLPIKRLFRFPAMATITISKTHQRFVLVSMRRFGALIVRGDVQILPSIGQVGCLSHVSNSYRQE